MNRHTNAIAASENFRKLVTACLRFCYDRSAAPIRHGDITGHFRNANLSMAARVVFPDSCHTVISDQLRIRFDAFVATRDAIALHNAMSSEWLQFELSRPKAFLVTDFAKSLFDGAVTPETDGFIDDDCMPPWDCWIDLLEVTNSYGHTCLVSWIPEWLSEKVDFGILVDAAECMSWLRVDSNLNYSLVGWGKRW